MISRKPTNDIIWTYDSHDGLETAYAYVEGSDHNAYELSAFYLDKNARPYGVRNPGYGSGHIERAEDNRGGSFRPRDIYDTGDIKCKSLDEVIRKVEAFFFKSETVVANITEDEYRIWNDIVDPHRAKNMTSDYIIYGRKKGSRGKFEVFNTWNGKFTSSIAWGHRFKDKREAEDIAKQVADYYTDYDVEVRQGSGTVFSRSIR